MLAYSVVILMHVVIAPDWADPPARRVLGDEADQALAAAREWTPGRAAQACGLETEDIVRGLDAELANQVATQLMAKDALGAHARDELGISDTVSARPVQAAKWIISIVSTVPDPSPA